MDHIPAVASVMTPFPYSIDVADSLGRARGLMAEHGIRHLPVLHDKTLVGVLSDRDVKRALDPEVGLPPRDELFVRDAYVSKPSPSMRVRLSTWSSSTWPRIRSAAQS
jgi:acetoin utilization protein AcuB